jgi:hypothetical protein
MEFWKECGGTVMPVEDSIVATLRCLPPEKQQEVLDFVQFLAQRTTAAERRNPEGMFNHLNISITEEDIDEARREMWGNFPREDI